VAKLNADGSAFLYNTLLAGSGQDFGIALALDARGNATVTGSTSSPDFPVTAGVVQPKLAGTQNAFVARLDGDGKLVFSTYLGGSGMDSGGAVQLDSAGNIYVAGMATSLDFPTTAGTFQPAPAIPAWGASPGGFVAKLTPDAHTLAYSTYLTIDPNSGGVRLLALNSAGEVYIAATVGGAGFPVTPNAPQPCFGGYRDILLAHLNAAGALLEATYLGTSGVFIPDTLSLAADGTVLLSASFPQPPGADQPTLARIRFGAAGWSAPPCLSPNVLHSATFAARDTISPGQLISLTGFGIGPDTGVAYQPGPQGQAPLALAGVQVSFDGQPAPLIYAQSRQINAVAPVELDGTHLHQHPCAVQWHRVRSGRRARGLRRARTFPPPSRRLDPSGSAQSGWHREQFNEPRAARIHRCAVRHRVRTHHPWVPHRRFESTRRREPPRHCIELGHAAGGSARSVCRRGADPALRSPADQPSHSRSSAATAQRRAGHAQRPIAELQPTVPHKYHPRDHHRREVARGIDISWPPETAGTR
jgi:hypothetical protein